MVSLSTQFAGGSFTELRQWYIDHIPAYVATAMEEDIASKADAIKKMDDLRQLRKSYASLSTCGRLWACLSAEDTPKAAALREWVTEQDSAIFYRRQELEAEANFRTIDADGGGTLDFEELAVFGKKGVMWGVRPDHVMGPKQPPSPSVDLDWHAAVEFVLGKEKGYGVTEEESKVLGPFTEQSHTTLTWL